MGVLALERPAGARPPPEPTLEEAVLRALRRPYETGCPVCGGALDSAPAGVACRDCGSRLERAG